MLVVDFGAQYAQLIARRVREVGLYSEIVPHTISANDLLSRRPGALILSGGPASIFAKGAPHLDPSLLEAGVPVLGICYGFQAMASALGGSVEENDVAEYGRTTIEIDERSRLFAGQPRRQSAWMSHRDAVVSLPAAMVVTASSPASKICAFEDPARSLYAVQWHPEVLHSEQGQKLLEHFLVDLAGCEPDWKPKSIIDESIAQIQEHVGDGLALCGLSGGVDSAVAAALVQRAIKDQLVCVFVDNGLLREGEREQVVRDFAQATGVSLHVEDAKEEFLQALREVSDPEAKRKAIGAAFIRAFERAAKSVSAKRAGRSFDFLVQGTLYPDVVESGGGSGTSVIKSHHNVGGLPKDLNFTLVEPLRSLFKDEVRAIGLELGLQKELVERHPFPGPGLAVRIIGEVTKERLELLRMADAIVSEELRRSGAGSGLWQCPVVLLSEVRTVGVQGDSRTYGHPIVLRPVTSEDAMTADWARLDYSLLEKISTRITNEVPNINRVVLDITSKPPGSIEWE